MLFLKNKSIVKKGETHHNPPQKSGENSMRNQTKRRSKKGIRAWRFQRIMREIRGKDELDLPGAFFTDTNYGDTQHADTNT